ncbi:hypothetical protein AAY473_005305 [Plecturocebus cupreus]
MTLRPMVKMTGFEAGATSRVAQGLSTQEQTRAVRVVLPELTLPSPETRSLARPFHRGGPTQELLPPRFPAVGQAQWLTPVIPAFWKAKVGKSPELLRRLRQENLLNTGGKDCSGTKGMHHHILLIFVFLVEMEFHHIDQTGLKLLTSTLRGQGGWMTWGQKFETQPGQHGETPSLLKIQKLASCGACACNPSYSGGGGRRIS